MSKENLHNDFSLFRKYYTGKMKPDEKSVFEKNLENDPFAQEAFEGFLELENDHARISAIENTNIKLKDKFGIETKTISFPIKTSLSIAATIILLISAYFIADNFSTNSKDVIAENVSQVEEFPKMEEIPEESKEQKNSIFVDSVVENELEDIEKIDKVSIQEITQEKLNEGSDKTSINQSSTFSDKPSTIGSSEDESFNTLSIQEEQSNSEISVSAETVQEANKADNAHYNDVFYKKEKEENKEISNFKQGINAYNQSDYKTAITKFEKSIKLKQKRNSATYYIGMSYFNQNKHNKALNYFDKVITPTNNLSINAKWFKSLSLINKGQKKEAKKILQELVDSNSTFKSSAEKKLKSL